MKVKDEQMRKMEETMLGLEAKVRERDTKNKALQDKVKTILNITTRTNIFILVETIIYHFARLKNSNCNCW